MSRTPTVLPPALPSELLTYIIANRVYPTTLVICSTREDFLASLTLDIHRQTHHQTHRRSSTPVPEAPAFHLLTSPLSQVAIARHIRVVFVPTASHLRVFLSLFSPGGGKVSAPPPQALAESTGPVPLLLVFGLLRLHRDTSEWSAQGLGNTVAALVDAAREARMRAVVVEPAQPENDLGGLASVLAEHVPVLSSSVTRALPGLDVVGWAPRSVDIRRVLGRWFHFREEESGEISLED